MEKLQALVDHYNRTSEATWRLWESRNRTFLLLLFYVVLATLFSNDEFLLAALKTLFSYLNLSFGEFSPGSYSYLMIQMALLVLVFFYTVTLYHRSASVGMHYGYLAKLEGEIRHEAALPPSSIAFTRESNWYWQRRPFGFVTVKYFYSLIIGILLVLLYYVRLSKDLQAVTGWNVFSAQVQLAVADLTIGVLTALAYLFYVLTTFRLDSKHSN